MQQTEFERLARRIEPGSRLLRYWPLAGGVSAQVTALEIEQPDGQRRKMIVRRHGAADLAANPQIAVDEFKLLSLLHSAGTAAPAPYYVDAAAEIFPTPCLVVEFIEGSTDFAPADRADYIRQFAAHLSSIHRLDVAQVDLSFLPDCAASRAEKLRQRPLKLDDSLQEARIRDTLEAAWPLTQRNAAALLHGDYWPGNLLWRDGRLAAIIDWEDAALGDPLADLANSRLEILWAFGLDAMQHFTSEYQTLMPGVDLGSLPYWDLFAALRPASKLAEWAGDPIKELNMRECHGLFVAQAYSGLG